MHKNSIDNDDDVYEFVRSRLCVRVMYVLQTIILLKSVIETSYCFYNANKVIL